MVNTATVETLTPIPIMKSILPTVTFPVKGMGLRIVVVMVTS